MKAQKHPCFHVNFYSVPTFSPPVHHDSKGSIRIPVDFEVFLTGLLGNTGVSLQVPDRYCSSLTTDFDFMALFQVLRSSPSPAHNCMFSGPAPPTTACSQVQPPAPPTTVCSQVQPHPQLHVLGSRPSPAHNCMFSGPGPAPPTTACSQVQPPAPPTTACSRVQPRPQLHVLRSSPQPRPQLHVLRYSPTHNCMFSGSAPQPHPQLYVLRSSPSPAHNCMFSGPAPPTTACSRVQAQPRPQLYVLRYSPQPRPQLYVLRYSPQPHPQLYVLRSNPSPAHNCMFSGPDPAPPTTACSWVQAQPRPQLHVLRSSPQPRPQLHVLGSRPSPAHNYMSIVALFHILRVVPILACQGHVPRPFFQRIGSQPHAHTTESSKQTPGFCPHWLAVVRSNHHSAKVTL